MGDIGGAYHPSREGAIVKASSARAGEALDSAVLTFRREECPSLSWSWRDEALRMTERGLLVPIDRSRPTTSLDSVGRASARSRVTEVEKRCMPQPPAVPLPSRA